MLQQPNFYLIFFISFVLSFNSFECVAQSNYVTPAQNYGFSFSTSSKRFQFRDTKFKSASNVGFGVGLFYLMQINQFLAFNVELKSSREYHKFITDGDDFNIRQNNLTIPLELQYHFDETNFFVFGGLEYSYNKQTKTELFLINRNSFATTIGFKYSLNFEHFRMVPEIKYSFGLNNSLAKFANANYVDDAFAKKSGVEFTIKFM